MPPPIKPEELQALCRAATIDPEPTLRALAECDSEEVRLTFGGHFKSGKSSLLNAALGRAVLPTGALPETGAACWLRPGVPEKAIAALADGGCRLLPCVPESLRDAASLLSGSGVRRPEVAEVERLEVTLAGTPMPPGACWIDTPGINDTPAMNARAFAATRTADLLVWVLSGKQFLSEVEAGFIADHVAARGPASVAFVLNVFLDLDTPEAWAAYAQRQTVRLRVKLEECTDAMGFDPDCPSLFVPVSARAAQSVPLNCDFGDSSFGDSNFGADALRQMLIALSRPDHPCVRRTRARRRADALRDLAVKAGARIGPERAANDKRRRQAESRSARYAAQIPDCVEACFRQFIAEAEAMTARLAAHPHEAADARQARVAQELSESAANAVSSLLNSVGTALASAQCRPLTKAQQTKVRAQLAIGPFAFSDVSDAVSRENILAGAGAGAVGLGLIPGIGHLVGGLIGAGVGYWKGRSESEGRRAAHWQAQIGAATAQISQEWQARRVPLTSLLLAAAQPRRPLASSDALPAAALQRVLTQAIMVAEAGEKD